MTKLEKGMRKQENPGDTGQRVRKPRCPLRALFILFPHTLDISRMDTVLMS
jgi:hypothetical protein